jgi:hypothetical protein
MPLGYCFLAGRLYINVMDTKTMTNDELLAALAEARRLRYIEGYSAQERASEIVMELKARRVACPKDPKARLRRSGAGFGCDGHGRKYT